MTKSKDLYFIDYNGSPVACFKKQGKSWLKYRFVDGDYIFIAGAAFNSFPSVAAIRKYYAIDKIVKGDN